MSPHGLKHAKFGNDYFGLRGRAAMADADKIRNDIRLLLRTPWDERSGIVVPETQDVTLARGAVNLEAAFLYADMADSTWFAQHWTREATAKVIRAFLNASTQVIRDEGGAIRSFDGDRVMAIFVGDGKCSLAARCALKINYAVTNIVHGELKSYYTDYGTSRGIGHCTGIAVGDAMIVRGGVFGHNDLISVGSAPNVAAKLSALRTGAPTYVTEAVYTQLDQASRVGSDGRNMWVAETRSIAGAHMRLYRSTYWWEL